MKRKASPRTFIKCPPSQALRLSTHGIHAFVPIEIERLILCHFSTYREYSILRLVCKRWSHIISEFNHATIELGSVGDWKRFLEVTSVVHGTYMALCISKDEITVEPGHHLPGDGIIYAHYPVRTALSGPYWEARRASLPLDSVFRFLKVQPAGDTMELDIWRDVDQIFLVKNPGETSGARVLTWKPVSISIHPIPPLHLKPTSAISLFITAKDIVNWVAGLNKHAVMFICFSRGGKDVPAKLSVKLLGVSETRTYTVAEGLDAFAMAESSALPLPTNDAMSILRKEINVRKIKIIAHKLEPTCSILMRIYINYGGIELVFGTDAYSASIFSLDIRG